MTARYRKTLRWSCERCGVEQTIRTANKAWAASLQQEGHERPCIDPDCRAQGGVVRLPVKLVTCDNCTGKTVRTIKGGKLLPGKVYCSHACKGSAVDDLEASA